MTLRSLKHGLGLMGVLMLVGCAAPAPQRVSTYTSPILLQALPARIVVVPFSAPPCSDEASALVTEAFALEIQRILHSDVVTASSDDSRLKAETAMWERGRIDTDALIAARKCYLADAFLFGAVTQYKPYDPPVVSVRLRLLSAKTGEVIWAAGGLFDARDADVRWLGEKFFNSSGLRDTLYGSDLVFMSPKLYATFVATQVLAPLDDKVKLQRADAVEKRGGKAPCREDRHDVCTHTPSPYSPFIY